MFNYINVWNVSDEKIEEEVLQFWKSHRALKDDQVAKSRVKQLVCIARNQNNRVIGVTTAENVYIELLNQRLFILRIFVADDYRGGYLWFNLGRTSLDVLESYHHNSSSSAIGIITIIQTPVLKKWKDAVWPKLGLTYIGTSPAGNHIRVKYFENSELTIL